MTNQKSDVTTSKSDATTSADVVTGPTAVHEVDYPAAHSVDTDWFAVDRDGNVAIFYSGENGPIPVIFDYGDGVCGITPEALLEKMEEVRGKKRNKWDEPIAEELGFYSYDAETEKMAEFYQKYDPDYTKEECPSPPYERVSIPAEPITLSNLPEEWRQTMELARLPDVSFSTAEMLQPGEHFPSVGWSTSHYLGLDCEAHEFKEADAETMRIAQMKPKKPSPAGEKPWWLRWLGP